MMMASHWLEIEELPTWFQVPAGFVGVIPSGWKEGSIQSASLISKGECSLLVQVLEGAGEADWGDELFSYQKGDLLTTMIGQELSLSPEAPTRLLCLELEGAEYLLEGIRRSGKQASEVNREMSAQYQNALEGLPGDIYKASAATYALLMELRRAWSGEDQALSPLVRSAKAIIREEYAYLSGIDELAERLEVTKSHLVRRFSADTGQGPGRYLQEVRLEQARLILEGRDYPVEVVAGMTGYSCANYFCKVFRREFGVSPGRYREEHRKTVVGMEDRLRLRELDEIHLL